MKTLSDVIAEGRVQPEPEIRHGAQFVAKCPDDGPWSLIAYRDMVLALSQESGLYVVEKDRLRKVEIAP